MEAEAAAKAKAEAEEKAKAEAEAIPGAGSLPSTSSCTGNKYDKDLE